MMAAAAIQTVGPDLSYEADLCGNIEQALKALQGYGVMALELIQNADDAGAGTLRIDARDDSLVIVNDAGFSRCSLERAQCDWSGGTVAEAEGRRSCNFHAITRMGGRSKLGAQDQIGRFGIGFVSVYQITDTPVVRSGGVEYTLNPREGRARRRDVDLAPGTEFVLPWAFSNSAVREAIHANVVPVDVADRVVREIADVLPSSVLFLRHLRQIDLCRSGRVVGSIEIARTDRGVDLAIDPGRQVQRWVVQSRDAGDIVARERLHERFPGLAELNRSTTVSVAIPADVEVEGLLYAYLPTRKETGLPLHINADFFPHASRQEIVLESESQERFWNEAMISAAAEIIRERFDLIKETLGHRRLWQLGTAASLLAGKSKAFSSFWASFSEAAKASESVWAIGGRWARPASVRSTPAQMPEPEQTALASFGLSILDPSLREHLNALSSTGVAPLKMADIATALVAIGVGPISAANPELKRLWSAINMMLEPPTRTLFSTQATIVAPLMPIPFLLDWSGAPVSPDGAWRLPENVPAELVRSVLPDLTAVDAEIMQHVNIARHIDLLDLDRYAELLARAVTDAAGAAEFFGPSDDRLRSTYRLFTLMWREDQQTNAGAMLSETPLLRNADGRFTPPSRAVLPGDFQDPTGWFHLVDLAPFPVGMSRFAEVVLGVGVMRFEEFVSQHLEDAICRGITREQYTVIMSGIADHRHQLSDVLDALAEIPFVLNRAGEFALPRDCYFWDAGIEAVLGRDPARWIDPSALPTETARQQQLRDLFESKLGMPTRAAAQHVVERVREIAESSEAPAEVKKDLTPIFRHILESWSRLGEDYRQELAELADIEFLPAQVDGEPDEKNLYLPEEVYRAGRAPGFSTQVPIIDLAPLRENRRAVNELLDLIGVPEEPETSVVVNHLIACIEGGRDPHSLTYLILGERCDAQDDLASIDRLRDLPFIFDPNIGYLRSSRVFWSDPPIGRYWHKANSRMLERQSLFTRLGVAVAPEPRHYAELVLEIAAAPVTGAEAAVHARCLRHLAEAARDAAAGAAEALDLLAQEESLLSRSGDPIWPGDALWLDSELHLAPFGDDLDAMVVEPPQDCDVAALPRLYARLGAAPLSTRVRLELAQVPDAVPDEAASQALRERADLLLRLPPTNSARAELRRLLYGVSLRLAPTLLTRAELVQDGVSHRSETIEARAFVDAEEPAIYLAGGRISWIVVARHLFDALAPLCPSHDMRSLAGTASVILQAPTLEDAGDAMASLGYAEQLREDEIESGEELTDADDWQPDPEIDDDDGWPGDTSGLAEGERSGPDAGRDDTDAPYKSRPQTSGLGESEGKKGDDAGRGTPGRRRSYDGSRRRGSGRCGPEAACRPQRAAEAPVTAAILRGERQLLLGREGRGGRRDQ
jgi:hypothetical protein